MVALAPGALPVTIEHGVDGAAGGHLHLTGRATQQTFADLRAPQEGLSRLRLRMATSTYWGRWWP